MTVQETVAALESIAPPHLAAGWDNVGLVLGDPEAAPEGPALLTLDTTRAVCDEAISLGASMIVSYHPPIFEPIRALNSATPRHAALLALLRAGVCIYSPHTALDAARGGLCDWLLDQCLAGRAHTDRRAIEPHDALPASQQLKLVVFCPPDHLEPIRDALAHAGAGVIGAYTHCSYRSEGIGSFLPGDNANPTVGSHGTIEHTGEHRLEMVCARADLPAVLAALRETHPYEEPAYDVFSREPAPDPSIGAGRIATLRDPIDAGTLASSIKQALSLDAIKLSDAGAPARTIACCPGAGSSLIDAAIALGADAFITGEASHHTLLEARERNLSIILAGHANTERPYLPALAERLQQRVAGAEFIVSTRDIGPAAVL